MYTLLIDQVHFSGFPIDPPRPISRNRSAVGCAARFTPALQTSSGTLELCTAYYVQPHLPFSLWGTVRFRPHLCDRFSNCLLASSLYSFVRPLGFLPLFLLSTSRLPVLLATRRMRSSLRCQSINLLSGSSPPGFWTPILAFSLISLRQHNHSSLNSWRPLVSYPHIISVSALYCYVFRT